jgi:general stress protein YciG
MAIPRRGLQDIRTLTGRERKATLPHEAYLRISHIEMEKARKTVESEKARQMMADIAARLGEIEAEKDELLREMGERGGEASLRWPGPPRSPGGFKVKY